MKKVSWFDLKKDYHIPQALKGPNVNFPTRVKYVKPGLRAKKGDLNIPRCFVKR